MSFEFEQWLHQLLKDSDRVIIRDYDQLIPSYEYYVAWDDFEYDSLRYTKYWYAPSKQYLL
jgi:hypothetical protein